MATLYRTRTAHRRRRPDEQAQGLGARPPAAPAPPRPAGAPPATPGPIPSPFDAPFENRRGLLQQTLNDTLLRLGQQEGTVKRQFGLDDPSDPFSRAVLLKKMYNERQAGSTNSSAAQGQLYAGSLQNALNAGTQNYTQGYDSLRKQQTDLLEQLADRRAQAQRDFQSGTIDASEAHIINALQTLPDPTEVVPPAPGAPPAAPRPPAIRRVRTGHRRRRLPAADERSRY